MRSWDFLDLIMQHYTDQNSWNAIRAQVDWTFKANEPPGLHEKAAYFTTLPPETPNLATRLRIPKYKIEYVFAFADNFDLKPLPGGRGDYIFYSPIDYVVVESRQQFHGRREEACSK